MSAKVKIIYKSGATIDVTVDDMTVKRGRDGLTINWTNMQPKPLMLGIDDISAIFEITS